MGRVQDSFGAAGFTGQGLDQLPCAQGVSYAVGGSPAYHDALFVRGFPALIPGVEGGSLRVPVLWVSRLPPSVCFVVAGTAVPATLPVLSQAKLGDRLGASALGTLAMHQDHSLVSCPWLLATAQGLQSSWEG